MNELPRAVLTGVVLGVIAGIVVWWLSRFETTRLHTEVAEYLDKVDRFRLWEAEQGGTA